MALADERAIYGRCRGFTPSEEDSFCYAGYTARKIISTLKCSNALAYDLLEEMVSDEEKSKLISVCLYTFEQINKSGIRYADFIVRYTGMDQDTRKATMSYCNAYSAGWCLTIRNETARTNNEMCIYNLSENYNNKTAMLFGEVYRKDGEWKFRAIGEGSGESSITEFAKRFE